MLVVFNWATSWSENVPFLLFKRGIFLLHCPFLEYFSNYPNLGMCCENRMRSSRYSRFPIIRLWLLSNSFQFKRLNTLWTSVRVRNDHNAFMFQVVFLSQFFMLIFDTFSHIITISELCCALFKASSVRDGCLTRILEHFFFVRIAISRFFDNFFVINLFLFFIWLNNI